MSVMLSYSCCLMVGGSLEMASFSICCSSWSLSMSMFMLMFSVLVMLGWSLSARAFMMSASIFTANLRLLGLGGVSL